MLQRQIDLFDEYKCRSMRDIVSAAANAAGTSPSLACRDLVLHHRSASDDADQHDQLLLSEEQNSPACRSGRVSGSDVGRTSRGTQRPVATVCRRDTMPPIHLMSATNESRSGLVQPQQLPLKLASSSDPTVRRSRWTSGSPAAVSSTRSPSEHPPDRDDPGQVGRNTPGHQPSLSSTVRCEFSTAEGEVTGHSDLGRTKRTAIQTSTGTVLRQTTAKYHALTTSSSPPSVVQQNAGSLSLTSKLSPNPSASSVLPLKLAERPRPKSASSSTSRPASTSAASTTRTQTSSASAASPVRTTSPGDGQLTRTTGHSDDCSRQHLTRCTISNPAPPPLQRDKDIIYF